MIKSIEFEASDGKKLFCRKMLPDRPVRAVALVCHGMNDHGGRYLRLGQALADLGMAVYIPDLRGHGETDPGENRGYLADKDGFERVLEDVMELCDFAAAENGNLPSFFFGHSFGGLIGMGLAGVYGKHLEGIVLSAPPQKPDLLLDVSGMMVLALGQLFRGARAPAVLPRKMTFGQYSKTVPGSTSDSDWISRDSDAIKAYLADPKCNFTCSYRFYHDLQQGIHKVYSPAFLSSWPANLPMYLFGGSLDPVMGMKEGFEKLCRLIGRLGLVDFESKCYEGGRHESLNELNAGEVLGDISDWFSRHLA